MNTDFIVILEKLKQYRKKGYMNSSQIDEISALIEQACSVQTQQKVNCMMEEITQYVARSYHTRQNMDAYVHGHMPQIAALLNKSERTIYRRLKEGSFTLIEQKTIQKYINEQWII